MKVKGTDEGKANFFSTEMPEWMGKLETAIGAGSGAPLVGKSLSLADLALFCFIADVRRAGGLKPKAGMLRSPLLPLCSPLLSLTSPPFERPCGKFFTDKVSSMASIDKCPRLQASVKAVGETPKIVKYRAERTFPAT